MADGMQVVGQALFKITVPNVVGYLKLETVESLSASPPTNKTFLIDDEDNSVVVPLAKNSMRYNPSAIHFMVFILPISGNGGKKVKLFTSALKDFQCNNRIVMTQRNHLDDFLRGRIIGRLECGRNQLEVSEKLGIAQSVISRLWQQFHDDRNVSRCHSICHLPNTKPNNDRYLAVTDKRNRRSTA
ncbi:transposable element Tcb1 transposase [Trichonephila clavipes]|nr:transposable element Tcb1 transposase [Trichonephila clavipes]